MRIQQLSKKYGDESEWTIFQFLANAGRSLERFHYYERRDIATALKHHVATFVGYVHRECVGYGHLDPDGDTVWLGICIADRFCGHGYGDDMMARLVDTADRFGIHEVTLGVAHDNPAAKGLFLKHGFLAASEGIVGHPELLRMVRSRRQGVDTVGSLVDKLATINGKLFISQEILYEIRRMDFDAFKAKYVASDTGVRQLWELLKKTCDLNVQRQTLIAEVDQKVLEIARAAAAGDVDETASGFVSQPHKTY